MKKNILMLIILLISLTFTACKIEKSATLSTESVELSISRNHGESIIYKENVSIREGDTAYSLLARNAKVETQYGGSFVSIINDIKSSKINGSSFDWFYAINGVEPNKGSKAYKVKAGDKINWDYHSWN